MSLPSETRSSGAEPWSGKVGRGAPSSVADSMVSDFENWKDQLPLVLSVNANGS
jgi:hypothetical protein